MKAISWEVDNEEVKEAPGSNLLSGTRTYGASLCVQPVTNGAARNATAHGITVF